MEMSASGTTSSLKIMGAMPRPAAPGGALADALADALPGAAPGDAFAFDMAAFMGEVSGALDMAWRKGKGWVAPGGIV